MKTLAIVTFCIFAMFAGSALAQTADGQTPAEESVCDVLDGAAWGLCNAYCEAMDCDSASPNASRAACDKVKGKFASLDQGNLPCEPVVCPCGTADDFIGLFTELEPGAEVWCGIDSPIHGPSLSVGMTIPSPTVQRFSALHNSPTPNAARCEAYDPDGFEIVAVNYITEGEYESCKVEVQSVADQLGLECVPW